MLLKIAVTQGLKRGKEYILNCIVLSRLVEVCLFLLQNGGCCGGKANGPCCCMNEKENLVECSSTILFSTLSVYESNFALLCAKAHCNLNLCRGDWTNLAFMLVLHSKMYLCHLAQPV